MDLISIFLILTTLISSFFGFVLLFHGRGNRTSVLYTVNILAILLWVVSMMFYRLASDQYEIYLWVRFLYISATLIASSFLYFTFFFPSPSAHLNVGRTAFLIFFPNLILGLLVATDGVIIQTSYANPPHEHVIIFGKGYIIYFLYILGYFNIGFYRLFRKMHRTSDIIEKRRITPLMVGYVSASVIAFATNLVLPWLGYFSLNWMGQVSGILMIAYATYAIFRYKLFNLRVVATEFLTFGLWTFILIRALFSESAGEQLANIALLGVSILFGIFLIVSIVKEVKQREEIEALAKSLKETNEKLRELDMMKSEFVSLATHQIRSPLTAIKGYTSLILEGDYGPVSKELRDIVKIVYDSCQNLVVIVNEFLDISRIEQGKMKYYKDKFDLKDVAAEAIENLLPNIEQAGLGIEFFHFEGETYNVFADKNKMQQVIMNLIDNAIKYTPQGSITIRLEKKQGKILLSVRDTGVGLDPEETGRLFEKFTRAKDANKVNVIGSGLGLYIAKQMIETQGGKIWVESPGKGKGSTFLVEMLEAS